MNTPRALLVLLALWVAGATAAHAVGLERTNVPQSVGGAVPVPRAAAYRCDPRAPIRAWTDWRVRLTLPVWIPGVTGTFAEGEADGGGGPPDQLFETDGSLVFALVGRVDLRYRRWGLMADGFIATLSEDLTFKPANARVVSGEITGILVRANVSYRFAERWIPLGRRLTRLTATAYTGVRSYNVQIVVNEVQGQSVRQDERAEWIDPIVGLRLDWDISRHIAVGFEGDIGGFGVGSDMAYWGSLWAEWRITRWFSAAFGYGVLDFEREFREGGEEQRWNLKLHGPMLVIGFRF